LRNEKNIDEDEKDQVLCGVGRSIVIVEDLDANGKILGLEIIPYEDTLLTI
jgi:uncharacterized protein YuzE